MIRRLPLNLRARVESRSSAREHLHAPGDAVLVFRGWPRWLVLVCPSGCGELVPVNLDDRVGPAWAIYEARGGVSLYPSVWRDTGCKAHFIIWRDEILVLEDEEGGFEPEQLPAELLDRVTGALASRGEAHFAELARELSEVPWTILTACEELVRRRQATHGKSPGVFRTPART